VSLVVLIQRISCINVIVTKRSLVYVMYLSTSFLYLFESKLHPLCISVQRFFAHKLFIFYCILTHFDIVQGLSIHCCIEYKPFFRLHIQASLVNLLLLTTSFAHSWFYFRLASALMSSESSLMTIFPVTL
jgi:hypothetical protein